MAEVAASRQMFADILSLIARLRAPPAPGMRDRRHQIRQATTAELRLDTATSARFSGSVPSTHRLADSMRAAGTIYPCPSRSETRSLAGKTLESAAGIRQMSGKLIGRVALLSAVVLIASDKNIYAHDDTGVVTDIAGYYMASAAASCPSLGPEGTCTATFPPAPASHTLIISHVSCGIYATPQVPFVLDLTTPKQKIYLTNAVGVEYNGTAYYEATFPIESVYASGQQPSVKAIILATASSLVMQCTIAGQLK
jgi:hypothetical protein